VITPSFAYDPVYPNNTVSVVLTSTNGIDWIRGSAPDLDSFSSLVYGDGIFVAGSAWNRCWLYTSVDGARWTPQFNDALGSAYRIAWGGGQFLAYSSVGFAASSNALDWTFLLTPEFGVGYLTYGNGLFLTESYFSDGQGVVHAVINSSPD